MTTPFRKYISQCLVCYKSEYEDEGEKEKMIDLFDEFEKAGYKDEDLPVKLAYENRLLVFQNPVISELIKEIKNDPKYDEYVFGNLKLKNYLIGNLVKKYPSIDTDLVKSMI